MCRINELTREAIELLKSLIRTPSFSKEEDQTADILEDYLASKGLKVKRIGNNLWTEAKSNSFGKKTILLNSHHDTVKPGNWKEDPFGAKVEGNKLIGLGSNDAGASLVSLVATFLYLNELNLSYNLILGISAEEEISGENGARKLLSELGEIDLGIVGEPTQMDMAIAERGLIVLDCIAKGKTGHAARNEGINALYLAVDDINFLRSFEFPKVSEILGKVNISVTKIESGTQHNVVPDRCNYLVDIRTNEFYQNQEIIGILKKHLNAELSPRSYHLNSSSIDPEHALVKHAKELNFKTFGSPTLSDQSVMNFPTVKIGPGDSARSHTPDEYIYLDEIETGIKKYIELLEGFEF